MICFLFDDTDERLLSVSYKGIMPFVQSMPSSDIQVRYFSLLSSKINDYQSCNLIV